MTTNLLPCGHEDYGVECLVCVPYGSLNPNNKSMSELEQVAHTVIGWSSVNKIIQLARACLVIREALEEFQLGHEHNESEPDYRPYGDHYGWCCICLAKVNKNQDVAKQALSKAEEIMKGPK